MEKFLTGQEFANEAEGWKAFDALVEKSGCFGIHREVHGEYIQPRMGCARQTARIDRILTPKPLLIDAGWPHGPVGVECKTSGKKIGPVIAQAQDYSRAVFFMPKGYRIMLEWVFIWPLETTGGDVGSVMAQGRIGYVSSSTGAPLTFGCGGTHGITVRANGTIEAKRLPMGNKAGCR